MRRSVALLVLLSSLASACSSAADDRLKVVASLYPLAWVAERVGGPFVQVEDLTPAGVEAHDATLSAIQRADIQTADVVLILGTIGFQPDIDRAVETASGNVLDVTEGLDLISAEGDLPIDPHLWLDPMILSATLARITAAFSAADPEHSSSYEANADATADALARLDSELRGGLDACDFRTFVTTHQAFGYLARAYDLRQLPLMGLDPEAEPSAVAIQTALDAIADGGAAPAVFAESTEEGRRIGATVAQQAGVALFGLSTLETDPAPLGYPAVMRANLESLQGGLLCG